MMIVLKNKIRHRIKKYRWHFLIVLTIATFFILYAWLSQPKIGVLTVAFLDVGQGDAIFIETPDRVQMLIDGGANSKVLSALNEVMPFYDRSIDIILATHPDQDHIGGLSEVLEKFNVKFVFESEAKSSSAAYVAFEKAIQSDTKKILTKRGDRIPLGKDIYIDVLFPDRDATNFESNTASIIAKLVYGNTSFLLTGDSPDSIEEYISALDNKSLDVDILKLGHHGSRTSTTETFLQFSSPDYAIISAGKDNKYGHPHKEVTDMLEKFEIKSLATSELGTIIFKSDGEYINLE